MFKPMKRNTSKFLALIGMTAAAGLLHVGVVHADTQKLRLGHVFAIDSPVDQATKEFAKLINERTNGAFEIAVFPNGQLGGDEALARDISRGSLDLGFVNIGSLSGLDPMFDILSLPYIVSNFDEADKIFHNPEGTIQRTLTQAMAKHRMEALGFYELEFRSVTNSKRPVASLADLEGLKLRVPGAKVISDYFTAAGAQTVTIPFPELFTALQQGTVDGQDNGPSLTYNSRLFEAQKYMTLTNHMYNIGSVAASQRFWNRLDEKQKDVFRATAKEVTANQIKHNRELNTQFIKSIEEGGVTVQRLSPEAVKDFRGVAEKIWTDRESIYGKERVDALRKEVEALGN